MSDEGTEQNITSPGDGEEDSVQLFTEERRAEAEEQIAAANKRIDYYITEYSIEILAQKTHKKTFIIPSYQRDFTWEEERKSRFIESVLMGLPIPFLFFWEIPETGLLEIVDGSQRLRTLAEFVHGGLILGELERLPAASGFRFGDLLPARRNKLLNRSIRGIILNDRADEQARTDLFERINTGSKVANKAEVRRGALVGPFLDLVIALSDDPMFKRLAPVPVAKTKLREREELVTRFFAYGDGLDDYADEVSPFLFLYSKRMNTAFAEQPETVDEYRTRFLTTMQFVERSFPYGFRRGAKGTATPRARFEAIAVGSYKALMQRPDLVVSPEKTREWLESREFQDVVGSDGANAIRRLENRINFVTSKLLATP